MPNKDKTVRSLFTRSSWKVSLRELINMVNDFNTEQM